MCTGSMCEDTCCFGWRIAIDKDTYKKYRECPDKELRERLDKIVTRQRSNPSDTYYAKIKLNKNGYCPLQDEDNLCALQRKLGEEYLSITCTTYPRISNKVNGVIEQSLSLSCPDAARLVLLNTNLMEFDESEEIVSCRIQENKILDTSDLFAVHNPLKYFWELRIFIITLLQNREYLIWQRLTILGLFCRSLDQIVKESKVHDIPKLIGSYQNQIESNIFKEEMNNIPKELTIQMELMKEITDERIFRGVTSKRFLECFVEFLSGIEYVSDAKKEDIGQRYESAYNEYYQPLIADHEYIMENYLVNHVFKNLFPLAGEKHAFDNYVMMVVHYAMIKLLLIGMAGFYKENFGIEHVIKLIQSFSRTVEHNPNYLKQVFTLLKANGFNTMPYMAILIKN